MHGKILVRRPAHSRDCGCRSRGQPASSCRTVRGVGVVGDPLGGHVQAHHADLLLAATREAPDATLEELRAMLLRERGVGFAVSTLWRFFERHRITHKKSRRTPPSRSARM